MNVMFTVHLISLGFTYPPSLLKTAGLRLARSVRVEVQEKDIAERIANEVYKLILNMK